MEIALASKMAKEHFEALGLDPARLVVTDVRGFWADDDGGRYFFSEYDGEMPRSADGKWYSPYRVWRALRAPGYEDEQVIARDLMVTGCPTCGKPFDRVEYDAISEDSPPEGAYRRVVVYRGSSYAFCVDDHRFRLDPDIRTR